MVYAQTRIRPTQWDAQSSLGFWDTNGSSNLGQTTKPWDSQLQKKERKEKKRRTSWRVDFAVPADYKVKLKESKKIDKFQDVTKELKKLWNTKLTVIPMVICVHGTVTKFLVLENKRISGDNTNYSIVEIGQNTKRSPGDLRRLVVTHTLVKNNQVTLVWKALKRVRW